LQRDLGTDKFELHWQPIVALKTMQTVGHEALVRWKSSDGRLRLPGDFITTAEESGLIVPLGDWVIRRALQSVAKHREREPTQDPLKININVTRRQLMEKNFVEKVIEYLSEYGVDGEFVNFEITESTVMSNPEGMVKTLEQLRDLGIQIFLDDFGTGYSSLSFLHRFPIDVLKIDRSFISGESQRHHAIVEAILSMANALKVDVVAEGIENFQQLDQLILLGCKYGQGFHLGKPMAWKQRCQEPFS